MKNLWFILYFPLALVVVWGAIWLANIPIYLTSFSISFLGVAENGGVFEIYPFWGFIYYAATTGIFYFWTMRRALSGIALAFIETGNRWLGRVLLLLLGFVVIAIYDPVVAGIMPSSLQDLITYANEELYAYLVGGANWVYDDFSGKSVSRMQYLVFDIFIAAFVLFVLYYEIFKRNEKKQDLDGKA